MSLCFYWYIDACMVFCNFSLMFFYYRVTRYVEMKVDILQMEMSERIWIMRQRNKNPSVFSSRSVPPISIYHTDIHVWCADSYVYRLGHQCLSCLPVHYSVCVVHYICSQCTTFLSLDNKRRENQYFHSYINKNGKKLVDKFSRITSYISY